MAFNKSGRLQKELIRLQKRIEDAKGIESFLEKERWVLEATEKIEVWKGTMLGPVGTPYEGQKFAVQVSVEGVEYPTYPPKVKFTNIVPFHANVFKDGNICIDILKQDLTISQWAPVMKIEDVMVSLVSMLDDPNTESPANVDASTAFEQDKTPKKENFAKQTRQNYQKQVEKISMK